MVVTCALAGAMGVSHGEVESGADVEWAEWDGVEWGWEVGAATVAGCDNLNELY